MGSFLVRHIAQTCSSMFYLSMIGFRIRVSEGPYEFFINVYQISGETNSLKIKKKMHHFSYTICNWCWIVRHYIFYGMICFTILVLILGR